MQVRSSSEPLPSKIEALNPSAVEGKEKAKKGCSFWAKVKRVVVPIFKYMAITAAFCVRPPLFIVGAVIGLISPRSFNHNLTQRIRQIWRHQDWATLTFAGVVILSTLPIALACSSLLAGAYCTASMAWQAEERARRHAEGYTFMGQENLVIPV
jgi:hypothetical protein